MSSSPTHPPTQPSTHLEGQVQLLPAPELGAVREEQAELAGGHGLHRERGEWIDWR